MAIGSGIGVIRPNERLLRLRLLLVHNWVALLLHLLVLLKIGVHHILRRALHINYLPTWLRLILLLMGLHSHVHLLLGHVHGLRLLLGHTSITIILNLRLSILWLLLLIRLLHFY